MEAEHNPVELNIRSDEIEAILGKTPNWIMKTGITVLFALFVILIIGSSFFRYPDIVNAKIIISSEYPSVALVTKVSGRLVRLDVKEKEFVKSNQLLGVLENAASIEDVMRLNYWTEKNMQLELVDLNDSIFKQEQQLGEIMPYFLDFKLALIDFEKFLKLNSYSRSKVFLQEQVVYTSDYIDHTKSQINIFQDELELTQTDYNRDSVLYKKQIISPTEIEQSKSVLLQKKFSLEGNMASLANIKTQLSKLKQNMLEIELDYRKQKQDYLDNIHQKIEALRDRIEQWDKMYVLRSPHAGQISFPAFWTKNQYIAQGEVFVNIIPSTEGSFIGKMELPLLKSGKVKTGQIVNIKLDNYPYMEYGILKGVIHSIAIIPSKNSYKVEVGFPEKMKTNYGTELPHSPEITGNAEVITEDYSLLQRVFFPIKALMKNNGPAFMK